MNLFASYLIESSIILGILSVYYWLVMHREPLFKFNRVFLLVSLLLATIIPFIHINYLFGSQEQMDHESLSYMLSSVNVYSNDLKQKVVPIISNYGAFKWLYMLGVLCFLFRLLLGLIRIGGLSAKATENKFLGSKIIDLPGRIAPFSFLNFIFINKSLYSENDLNKILLHENAHVRFKHSLDIIFFEILLIIQWFNPFAWLVKQLLKELHEFQADNAVLKTGTSVGQYKELLLFQSTDARLLPVNNFNQSIIKKRFKMMKNSKINNKMLVKACCTLFVVIGVGLFFACDNSENPIDKSVQQSLKSKVNVEATQDTVIIGNDTMVVERSHKQDVMPKFPGGMKGLKKFIAKNVMYPEEARKNNIQGRVFISFVVSETGKVQDVKVARSVHKLLDEEAIRVVKSIPDWIPGKKDGKNISESFTIPINFVNADVLNENNSTQKTSSKGKSEEVVVVGY